MSAVKSIDKKIVQCLPQLNLKQKQTVLTVVKTFIEDQEDWWNEIGAAQQKAIDKSLTEMKAGKLTTHAEVMKKHNK